MLFQLVVLKIYGSIIENSRNAKYLAVPVGGLNGKLLCHRCAVTRLRHDVNVVQTVLCM